MVHCFSPPPPILVKGGKQISRILWKGDFEEFFWKMTKWETGGQFWEGVQDF